MSVEFWEDEEDVDDMPEYDFYEEEIEKAERLEENRKQEFDQRSRFWEPEGGEW